MGTGKSSTGRILSGMLQYRLVDTDECIERKAGRKITEIFEEQGEEAFRKLECGVVADLAGAQRTVISTGGGLIVNPENLASLRKHSLIICLWASPEAIWERVRNQSHRPLLHDPDPLGKIRSLLQERAPAYREADILVSTEKRPLRDVAQHIITHFRTATRLPK